MAMQSITGTYLDQDIFAFGYPMPDGWTYFTMRYLYRYRSGDKANPITYVEQNNDYYQSQRWSSVEGFKLKVQDFDPDNVTGGAGPVAPGGEAGPEKAVQWAIAIANDDTHGYDQTNRHGPDYDCSSFVSYAFINGGINVPVSSTRDMISNFIQSEFAYYTDLANRPDMLQRGDVLIKKGSHAELYIGQNQLVGAHYNEFGGIVGGKTGDQSGYEISITPYYSYPWDGALRYLGYLPTE